MSPTTLLSPSPLAPSTITLRGNTFDTARLRILLLAALPADHSLRSPLDGGADVCPEYERIAELVHGPDWAGFL